jgi:hypothetical protein
MLRHPDRLVVPALAILLCGLAAFSTPTLVVASPSEEIQALYDAAKADLKDGRHVFALKKFKQALALATDDPEAAWPMLMGAALTYQQMGQIEFTLEYYRRFLDSVEKNRAAVTDKWTSRIRVVEEQVTVLENTLLEERGLVEVNSNPAGASVTVDGNAPGADGNAVTPFSVYVAPGSHTLKVEKDGFQPSEIALAIKPGVRESRTLQLAEKRVEGRLLVATGAPDANVSVDGAPVGTGRDVSLKVAAGPHVVKVERAGHVPFEKSVNVGAGAIVRVEALLAADKSAGAPEGVGSLAVEATSPVHLDPLWGWIGGGAGVAMVGVGAVFSVLRNNDVSSIASIDKTNPATLSALERKALFDRRGSLASSVNTKGVVAGVFYGLGGAAVVGSAVYLAFFADWGGSTADPAAPAAPPPVSLLPLPGGGGVAFQVSW